MEETEQEIMDAAVAAMTGDTEKKPAEKEPEKAKEPAEEESAEPAKEAEKDESKTDLWKRITEQDRELRELRKKEKQTPQDQDMGELKKLASESPQEFLERFGLTFDKVFDAWSTNLSAESERPTKGPPQAEQAIVREVQELKQKLSQYEEQQRQQESSRFHMAEISRFEQSAGRDSDRWALVNSAKEDGSLELAFQVAVKMYQTTGDVPDHGYVLDCVEEQLRGQAQKFSKWLGAVPQKKEVTLAKSQPASGKAPAPTLSGSSGEDTQVPETLSDEDLFQLALAELKKG